MRVFTRVLAAASALLLAGCFDAYQHITKERNGHVSVYFKIAMSKAFLNMANGAGGSGGSDSSQPAEDPFAEFQNSPMVTAAKELGSSISGIDNDTEFGLVMRSSLDLKSKAVRDAMKSGAGPLVPQVSDSGITLFFPSQNPPSNKDEGSGAILTSFKYRLSVGKALMPTMSKVVLRTGDTETVLAAVDLPDMYLIEVPLSSVFSAVDAQLVLLK
jgi:hypothetical protein